MHSRKQLANVIDQILTSEQEIETLERNTVEDYKKLNEKCDVIIGKIKERKSKKNCKKIGE